MTSRTPLAIAAILFTAPHAMADAASPTIVRDVSDASALYVLMPMRV